MLAKIRLPSFLSRTGIYKSFVAGDTSLEESANLNISYIVGKPTVNQ